MSSADTVKLAIFYCRQYMEGNTAFHTCFNKAGKKFDIYRCKMAEWKLTRSEVIKFINIYKQKECLWNYKSTLYKRVDLKKEAWLEIAKEFMVNVELAKKKMKALRTAYIFERKKVESSKKSGAAGNVYQPNLYYYEEFNFLNEAVKLRESTSSANLDDSEHIEVALECKEQIISETSSQQSEDDTRTESCTHGRKQNRHEKKKFKSDLRQAISSKYYSAIEKVVLSAQQQPEEEDVFSSFAKSIQFQLKQLPPINAADAMAEMQSVMSKHTRQVLLSASRVNIISHQVFKPPHCSPPIMRSSDSACSSGSLDSGSDISFCRTSTPSTSLGQSHRNDTIEKAMLDAYMFDDVTSQ